MLGLALEEVEVADVEACDEVNELVVTIGSFEEELVADVLSEEFDDAEDIIDELIGTSEDVEETVSTDDVGMELVLGETDEVTATEDDDNSVNVVDVEKEELAEVANDSFVYRFNLLPPPQYSVLFPLQS